MKISNVSNNSFGMKITDNIAFQTLGHFWSKKFSAKDCREALERLRRGVSDSFELTFMDFRVGSPCEIKVRGQQDFAKSLFVQFAKLAERKQGRPSKTPANLLYDILSPQKTADMILETIAQGSSSAGSKEKLSRITITNNEAYKRLIENWKRRATEEEINNALETIRNCAGESYSLQFKTFSHENPTEILLTDAKGMQVPISITPIHRIIKRGRKPKIPREALSPMQVAKKVSSKIVDYIKGIQKPAVAEKAEKFVS